MTLKHHLAVAECPVARTVDQIGEWWSLLILRDALEGITRFGDFVDHLGISPAMLSQRLAALTAAGLLRRRRYQERPPRDEYLLTARGREFGAVLLAMAGWWNGGPSDGAPKVVVVDSETGAEVVPIVVDANTGEPIEWPRHRFAPGPRASARTRALLAAHDPAAAAARAAS